MARGVEGALGRARVHRRRRRATARGARRPRGRRRADAGEPPRRRRCPRPSASRRARASPRTTSARRDAFVDRALDFYRGRTLSTVVLSGSLASTTRCGTRRRGARRLRGRACRASRSRRHADDRPARRRRPRAPRPRERAGRALLVRRAVARRRGGNADRARGTRADRTASCLRAPRPASRRRVLGHPHRARSYGGMPAVADRCCRSFTPAFTRRRTLWRDLPRSRGRTSATATPAPPRPARDARHDRSSHACDRAVRRTDDAARRARRWPPASACETRRARAAAHLAMSSVRRSPTPRCSSTSPREDAGRHRRRGPGRADSGAAARGRRHRERRARGPQPRLRRAADPRGRARAGHRRAAARGRRRESGCDREGIVHHGSICSSTASATRRR